MSNRTSASLHSPALLISGAFVAFGVGCSGALRTTPEPAAVPSVVTDARCAALADSVATATAIEQLQLVSPRRGFRPPTLPSDVAAGASVEVSVRIRPDGAIDPGTLTISGTSSDRYRSQIRTALEREHFNPPRLNGCAVPGRFTLVMSRERGPSTSDT
jgi:hypothetical protein